MAHLGTKEDTVCHTESKTVYGKVTCPTTKHSRVDRRSLGLRALHDRRSDMMFKTAVECNSCVCRTVTVPGNTTMLWSTSHVDQFIDNSFLPCCHWSLPRPRKMVLHCERGEFAFCGCCCFGFFNPLINNYYHLQKNCHYFSTHSALYANSSIALKSMSFQMLPTI